jgi:Zn-dependent M28 family amino/carboxypeptidase
MDRADEIIAKIFSEAGWLVERHSFDSTNVMGCLDYAAGLLPAGVIPTLYPHLSGANILGWKKGSSSTKAIIVAAHHDTIRDSPGADDNSASVAALFELARVLAPYSFEKTIVLAAMDMEEIGFFGSKELVRRLAKENQIEGAIVYETMAYTSFEPGSQEIPKRIGWLYPGQMRRIRQRQFTGDWTLVFYKASAASLARSFAEGLAHTAHSQVPVMMRDPLDIALLRRVIRRITPNALVFGRSDHLSFWEAGIPAIMVTDTANFRNPNYHQPTDTPETLDYDRLAAIVGATAVTIARSAGLTPAAGAPQKKDEMALRG